MDFFLWGYIKDVVYNTKFRDINDLKERITDAIATVDEAMLERTWMEIEYRLDVLRATNGANVEVFLNYVKRTCIIFPYYATNSTELSFHLYF
jgi:uncharacterized protein with LGFP repeats